MISCRETAMIIQPANTFRLNLGCIEVTSVRRGKILPGHAHRWRRARNAGHMTDAIAHGTCYYSLVVQRIFYSGLSYRDAEQAVFQGPPRT